MINEKKLIDELKQSGMIADNEYGNAMIDMINSQPKIGGWIPCSERLPEKDGFSYPHAIAFAYEDNGWNMYIAVYDFWEDKKWRMAHEPIKEIIGVVAWQPLPEEYHGQMD